MDPQFLESEEKRSYGALFLLVIALLVACSAWAIWQDAFSRHLWKKYKTDFYRYAIEKWEGETVAERERLAGIEDYTKLESQLAEVRGVLAGSGAEGTRLAELRDELHQAELGVGERDLDLRIVKGEIEEGWYRLDQAHHHGHSGDEEKAELDRLFAEKVEVESAYNEAVAARDAVQAQIDAVHARETELEESIRPYHAELDVLGLKLEGVSMDLFGHRFARVPVIEQVALPDFERNNFDNWVARVERCQNCHVAIDRDGFEDMPNPLMTHPDRGYYLGNHEVRKFGCTPCHGGQGASINSVEQAHGFVAHWEDPLLDTSAKVQAKCMTCHVSAQGLKGASVVARGEFLFSEMGCHGCHLIQGFESLPKAGPSLKRIAAKVSPEWMVNWIENPKAFRPRTRMPHFFLSREESVSIAAYLFSASLDDAEAWLDEHDSPAAVDPDSPSLVKRGEELTQTLGCLGCHGFKSEEFASQVALSKDTAPNLARIAEKTNARWAYQWIRDPRSFSDTARMPRLRLSGGEAAAITSYLMTLREAPTVAPDASLRSAMADPDNIAAGEALVRKYGCFGCHHISGMEKESRVSVELSTFGSKSVEELFFGDRLDIPATWDDWAFNKILTPRTYATDRIAQAMPEFAFEEEDVRALVIFLSSRIKNKINPTYKPISSDRPFILKHGRELVRYYNCQGCHSFDGREGAIRRHYTGENEENAPPILVKEGIKLQPDWFVDFLKKPMRLRPWLKVRMPTFGLSDDEADAIVNYFAALDGYDVGPVVVESREESYSGLPDYEVDADHPVDCAACHPSGSGRVPDDEYSVSRHALTHKQRAEWMAEHLGLEQGSASADVAERAQALAKYLGGSGS